MEVRYEEEDHQSLLLGEGSARRPRNTLSPAIQQAVERTPAMLRLGSSLAQGRRSNPPRAVKKKAPQAKQPPKRKTIAKVTGVTRSRGNKSPIQGARASKQLAAKARLAARKRLCVEENKSPSQVLPLNKDGFPQVVGDGVGTSRGRVDFQNPPDLIP